MVLANHWYTLRCATGMLGGYPPHPPTEPQDDVPRNPFKGYGPVRITRRKDGSEHYSRLQMRVEGPDVVFYVQYSNELTLIELTRFAREDAVKLALDTLLLNVTTTLYELWLRLLYLLNKILR
jgi:hypothetical protein